MRAPLLVLLLMLPGCDDAPGKWSAIVYPDRADRSRYSVTPRFKTFSYCRDAAIERMKAIQVASGGDYACGYECDDSGDPRKLTICKETRK
jgi:hypothetical protein